MPNTVSTLKLYDKAKRRKWSLGCLDRQGKVANVKNRLS